MDALDLAAVFNTKPPSNLVTDLNWYSVSLKTLHYFVIASDSEAISKSAQIE